MIPLALQEGTLAIVDDDASVRDALSMLLKLEGFSSKTFGDGDSFLEAVAGVAPVGVILDLNLPGRSGLDVLRRLAGQRFEPPVFVISGQSDVPLAVEAMKLGALDFFEKPFSASVLIERVREAVTAYRRSMSGYLDGLADFPGRDLLTKRERDVLVLIAGGASNKEAGRRLGISPRTIEVHRAHIMDKLCARNAADLMRIVMSYAPREIARTG
ncbi:MAG: DNA-binding response regulator [Afipia sp. 62-7]|nr:response regulator [Afipia sp.]OJU18348.1 MAG: DNA-binding response regulator [Afipia sp. 62-7]